MKPDKIATAVKDCLETALHSRDKHPFERVRECLDGLKGQPDWSADEIIEVQTRLIGELVSRLPREHLGGPPTPGCDQH